MINANFGNDNYDGHVGVDSHDVEHEVDDENADGGDELDNDDDKLMMRTMVLINIINDCRWQ